MFRGIHIVNIDPKGRFAIPTKYRNDLCGDDNGMVITIDTDDPCLLLYSTCEWEKIENKLKSMPSFQPQVRRIQRLLIGHASDLEMDAQGRVLLPSLLKSHAKLDKQLVLIGQGHKFEIWSQELWSQESKKWIEQKNLDDLGVLNEVSL